MKITIKGLIKQHLVKVCTEKTKIMREYLGTKTKKQFTKKKSDEAYAKMRKALSVEGADAMFEGLAILLDAPELSRSVYPLEVFGVIVLGKCTSAHPYGIGVPCIVTKNPGGSGNRVFTPSGDVDSGYQFVMADEPRPATDSEIKECIDNLTEGQWTTILNPASIFKEIVQQTLASEVELLMVGDGTDSQPEDGAEIEANGRKITVGNAKE